jgi:hypothetical protein
VIDGVFEAGVVVIHDLLGIGFQLWINLVAAKSGVSPSISPIKRS